jgi:T-complex protein 1 subunit beta
MASFNPTQIFDDGTTEEKGENARLSAFVGAIAVGDLGMLLATLGVQQLMENSQVNSRAQRNGQDSAECLHW